MMPDSALLEILRCPSTGQTLSRAPDKLVWHLESERVAGRLMDDAGNPVVESFDRGLIREDGLAFYPVRRGIPVMTECVPVKP